MSDAQTNIPELPPSFAYEGEHPQVRLPFAIILEGRKLKGESLSVTRAVATGLVNPNLDGHQVLATLRFDLEGFTVSFPVDVVVGVAGRSEDAEVIFVFANPTGQHLPAMRYLLNSFIAGDVVSIAGMLSYTGPVKVKATNAADKPSPLQRLGRVGRKAIVVALTAGLVFLAADVIMERVVYAYEPRPVQVVQEGQLLRATAAGQISYVDAQATEGDVIYSILANSGDLLSVRMPCDCSITATDAFAVGATVLPGAALVQLTTDDTRVTATSEISYEGTARLLGGDQAELVLTDGRVVPVTLELLPIEGTNSEMQPVTIVLPDDVSVAPGTPARLRFQRQLLPEQLQI
ncbi:hypothetical protein [Loktanella sp. R86503]|uniref:hypothetical protein n=1 Tax=Loktanella sp. R86503 TaxID=3093847 RepID=UPI0036DC9D6A